MASQAAYAAEKAIGHQDDAITAQDVTEYSGNKGDDGELMKALVWQGKNKVEVVTVPKPKILEATDVILKVTGSTLCGSDLHLLHGSVVQMNKGDILGHEFCGVVDQVGSAVTKAQVGKRYVASFQIACGSCERTNSNTMEKSMYGSQTAGMFGYSHFTGGFAGGQAEYVRVPLGDVNLLAIPDNVPDEKALYLSDVLATSYNCVKDTAVYPNDQVAIWGAGPIGQMAGAFALDEGASKVIFVDTEPRLSYIKSKWPAAHADKLALVDYTTLSHGVTNKETVVSRLKELCGGRGPDAALECAAGEYPKGWLHTVEIALGAETDTSEIVNEMIEGVRNFGRAGITGVYVGYTNHFNIGSLMERGVRLIGNGQAPVHLYWEDLLKKIQEGKIDVYQMLSHRIRLDDLDKVYYKFDKHEDGIQKIFVETKFSFPRAEGSPELTTY
ncbi:alcohol dehydrogenase GroES-like domain-containing protein [Colletotrichum lupini]|uniref:Alcohol dehydrogenase GroES-like domain-containing protein n=1 Tax=Colletotrichum lupini TaxID=145971 RepID=A0A9Q8SF54_9PEZI|nr:alcohol dehydrogenase GroES-like domain-containing protein [Colletotrichum lupini]UQC75791.1 alcohol dehydrogenase GroES-like domain-containing protein [Colletotrichum lupini]